MGETLIVEFLLDVCVYSGDPGCLGWPEGYHDEPCEYDTVAFHRCAECGADDVYGDLEHLSTCSAVAAGTPPGGRTP